LVFSVASSLVFSVLALTVFCEQGTAWVWGNVLLSGRHYLLR
jgi:hypothetical protein